jgi:hypothetical protein
VSPLSAGQGAAEWAAHGKAASEIAALWAWLRQIAGMTAKHKLSERRG